MTLAVPSMILARGLAFAALACFGVAPASAQDATLERGRYLVTTIMACGNCHTPKDAQGRAIAAQELAGGGVGFDIPPFAGVAANITPDRETGIGTWSDDEIKRAITQGVARDGRKLKPPMAYAAYATMTAQDLDAIVAFVRTMPPLE
jgi:mono/diheme cytochrome c family protein